MRIALIAFAGILLALNAGAPAAAEHASEDFDLRDFSKIEISGVFELDVRVGGDYSVSLTGPEREMDRVEASVEDGTLILDTRDRRRGDPRFGERDGVKAVITLPMLDGIDVSGVVEGGAVGIDADAFEAEISGVGELSLSGECERLQAEVSGVGALKADALKCRDVSVEVSGVGEASVYASESVDAEVAGMGEINVDGSPKTVSKSGGLLSEINIR